PGRHILDRSCSCPFLQLVEQTQNLILKRLVLLVGFICRGMCPTCLTPGKIGFLAGLLSLEAATDISDPFKDLGNIHFAERLSHAATHFLYTRQMLAVQGLPPHHTSFQLHVASASPAHAH